MEGDSNVHVLVCIIEVDLLSTYLYSYTYLVSLPVTAIIYFESPIYACILEHRYGLYKEVVFSLEACLHNYGQPCNLVIKLEWSLFEGGLIRRLPLIK